MAVHKAMSSATSPGHKDTARPAASHNHKRQKARKERQRSYSSAFITLIAQVCYMARSQWRLMETLSFDCVCMMMT